MQERRFAQRLWRESLSRVIISGEVSGNRETGIMISNSEDVFIHDAVVRGNPEHGILCQGRLGGNRVTVVTSDVRDNGSDFSELHDSAENWWFIDPRAGAPLPSPNRRTMRRLAERGGTADGALDWVEVAPD